DATAAVAQVERVVGPRHPQMGRGLRILANVQLARGDAARARPLAVRAVELAANDEARAWALNTLVDAAGRQRDFAAAEAAALQAVALGEKVYGAESSRVALSLSNLMAVQIELGRQATAIETGRRSLAIMEKAFGPEHEMVAMVLVNLGEAALELR